MNCHKGDCGGGTGDRKRFGSVREPTQLYRFAHGAVSGGGRMQMITTVVGPKQMIGRLRVADNSVKIDNRIKMAGSTDPGIDGLAVGFA
jgi:hypothetical protein